VSNPALPIALAMDRPRPGGRLSPGNLVWPAASGVLAILVLMPLGWLVLTSFQSDDTGALTLQNYIDAFRSWPSLVAIANTLLLAFVAASAATVVGSLLAWLITRTDLPLARILRALVLASFVTPSFMGRSRGFFSRARMSDG
jgi:iron(III) transport system permease protein